MTLIATATSAAVAQQPAGAVGTVTGQVLVAESKAPLQGALVSVTGTTLRATATAEGRYVLRNVPPGTQTIRVQLLGFSPREQTVTVTAGGTATSNFEMKDIPYAIAPVVTTALGIAREEKSLGYATTSISAATLEKIPETTMMQALAGQSAGVAMTSASGRPGAGARVVIRGETSFSGTGQPLFVIDGVPVSTASDSRSDALGTGVSGSRQMDFDMESVEELTILKGAAVTALYGSRAANGRSSSKQSRANPVSRSASTSAQNTATTRRSWRIYHDWAAGNRGYYCNGKNVNQGGWCEPGSPTRRIRSRRRIGVRTRTAFQIVLDSVGAIRIDDPRADFM
jgi:hypothetical protein